MIYAVILHQFDALLHRLRVSGSAESAESMMVCVAFQQHFLAIQHETLTRNEAYLTYAEALCHLIAHAAILTKKSDSGGIEVRMLAIPQFCVRNLNGRNAKFLTIAIATDALKVVFLVAYHSTVR